MDPGSDSDSEERVSWEVVASDPDSGLSDSNGDVQVHDHHGITVLAQHFGPCNQGPEESLPQEQEAKSSPRGREEASSSSSVRDWIEPVDDQQGSGQQHDLDLLTTLVSSVLESEPEKKDSQGESSSLDREVLGEAGFSSLVPSDIHGNVLRPEEQEEGGDGGQEVDGIGKERNGWGWSDAIVGYIRGASTLWSITIAAAVMGLVIIGHRWRHERWQNHQLRLQLCYKDEKISQLLFQIARLKETVSGRRRVPVIKAASV